MIKRTAKGRGRGRVDRGAVVKTASGRIVKVRVKARKLNLKAPMAIVTYTSPGLGISNPDTTPDQFTFVDQTGVPILTVITSNTITVTGITLLTPISISGTNDPEYQINSEPWTNAAGVVSNLQEVTVRHTSSSFNGIPVDTVVNIGGVTDTFTSTTSGEAGVIDSMVLFDGLVIPPDSILYQEGAADNTELTTGGSGTTAQTGKTMIANEFIDFKFRDTSDGSEGIITGNSNGGSIFFSGGLTGGNNNTVSAGHYWEVVTPIEANDEINYASVSDAGGAVVMSVKGVPSVTGVNGNHTIGYNLTDVSVPDTSPDYQVTITL